MRREVESSRDLYEGLLKKLKEAGILAGLKSSNINIVDPASVPVEPIEPKIPLNIALGCMGGLLFGMALAFVVENVDNSIRTPEDIEAYCSLPSLGVIPRGVLAGRHNSDKSLVSTAPPTIHSACHHGASQFRQRGGFPGSADFLVAILPRRTAASHHGNQCHDAGRKEFHRSQPGGGVGPDRAENASGGRGHASSHNS